LGIIQLQAFIAGMLLFIFDKAVIRDYVNEFSRVLVKGGRGIIHHSNLGENANDDISKNPHWRSNMSEDLFKEYCSMFGLNVDLQKMISWGEIKDGISVFSK
jgi:hypothetical protein